MVNLICCLLLALCCAWLVRSCRGKPAVRSALTAKKQSAFCGYYTIFLSQKADSQSVLTRFLYLQKIRVYLKNYFQSMFFYRFAGNNIFTGIPNHKNKKLPANVFLLRQIFAVKRVLGFLLYPHRRENGAKLFRKTLI